MSDFVIAGLSCEDWAVSSGTIGDAAVNGGRESGELTKVECGIPRALAFGLTVELAIEESIGVDPGIASTLETEGRGSADGGTTIGGGVKPEGRGSCGARSSTGDELSGSTDGGVDPVGALRTPEEAGRFVESF